MFSLLASLSGVAVNIANPTWELPYGTENEKSVLAYIQNVTKINNKNALATILGSIKQESNFHPDICEGGARVSFNDCRRGGYGIIQWTYKSRYNGLGQCAIDYNCDPSTLTCQLDYMINEPEFQDVLPEFQMPDCTIEEYNDIAHRWLGWGVEGNRVEYSHEYKSRLEASTVNSFAFD